MRDELTIYNERLKLFAGFFDALAIGLLGLAVLRPLTDDLTNARASTMSWLAAEVASHGAAHYILGYLKKEPS